MTVNYKKNILFQIFFQILKFYNIIVANHLFKNNPVILKFSE